MNSEIEVHRIESALRDMIWCVTARHCNMDAEILAVHIVYNQYRFHANLNHVCVPEFMALYQRVMKPFW